MVCPYCSTDMEPIELGGKTFCSNCGLSVGAASPQAKVMINTSFAKTTAPATPILNDAPPAPLSPQTPIKDGIKTDLGLPVNEADDLIIANSSPEEPAVSDVVELQQPVKLSVTTETEKQPLTNDDGFYTSAPNPETLPQDTPVAPEVSDTNPETEESIPPLGQTIEIPNENDFEAPGLDATNDKSLEEKVQNVDTLGASGILLDILNENYQAAGREENVKALEAAEELIDDISTPSEAEAHAGVLLDKPENPIENPEIAAPLSTTEIEAPEHVDTTDIEPQIEPAKPTKTVVAHTHKEEVEDSEPKETPAHSDELYMLPHEIEKSKNPAPTKEVTDEIEMVEEKLASLEDPIVDPEITSSKDYDPDAVAPLAKEVVENYKPVVETTSETTKPSVDLVDTSAEDNSPAAPATPGVKQEVIKSFFKEKIEGPKKQKKVNFLNNLLRKSPKKSPKKGTESVTAKVIAPEKGKKRLPLWLKVSFGVVGGLFLVLTITFSLIYFFKPAEQQARTQQAAEVSNFDSLIPATLPPGYEMSSSNYDEGKKKLTVKYAFVNDKSKTLTYTQAQANDAAAALAEYIGSNDKATFVTHEQDGTTFTELSTGTLVWTKDGFLFTIETVKYDFAQDLLYKMALSLG